MINTWQTQKKDLLILDAGDLLFPRVSGPVSDDQKRTMNLHAKAIVAAFNHMGCDAITVGEDDFLLGKKNLLHVISKARFPVISANLIDREKGTPLFKPYIVKTIEDLRIGIFGLFPLPKSGEERLDGLTVEDPMKSAHQVVSRLRKETDFIILLSHVGYAKDLELAKKLDGINVIVGGHDGINLNYPRIIRNTVVLQVANRGRYLGKVDLSINDPSLQIVNLALKDALHRKLAQLEERLKELDEKPVKSKRDEQIRERFVKQKIETEKNLKTYDRGNKMVNEIVPLRDTIEDDPEAEKVLEPYLNQIAQGSENSSRNQQPSSAQ